MRVAQVIGSITLSRRLDDVPPGRFLIVRPEPLDALRLDARRPDVLAGDGGRSGAEPVVTYDELGAGRGTHVGISEGREAAMPFHPRPVPIDVYCAALLDAVDVSERGM